MNATQLTQKAGTKSNGFFDVIMYARAYINEIKVISPKKGSQYAAVNASLLGRDANVDQTYQTVDLIVSGEKVKNLLRPLWDRRPQNPMQHDGPRWLADINIGSLYAAPYIKKDGDIGAVLKGRLINIRALRIGDETVFGKLAESFLPPVVVAPGYINLINPEKGIVKFAMLDGPCDKPESHNVTLTLEEVPAINELIARDLCPRGYAHLATNPKIFALLEIAQISCEGFKGKDGAAKSALKGVLSGVRYLKANGEVIVAGQTKAAA